MASTPCSRNDGARSAKRARVAVDRIHELLDLFACGIAGSSRFAAGGIQHAFDQFHRILAIELMQFAPVPLRHQTARAVPRGW